MVKVLRSVVCGPLEPYAAGFVGELLRRGYSSGGADQQVCFVAHLDRWMLAEGVGLCGLSTPTLQRYLGQRRAAGYREYLSMKALAPLLEYLLSLGVLPVEEPVDLGPVEELLESYRRYLLVERGVTAGTARGYVDNVRPFVTTRLRGSALDLAGISAADVTGFIGTVCPGRAIGSAKLIVCAGVAAGLAAPDRAAAGVAGWGGAGGGGVEALQPGEGTGAGSARAAAGQLRQAHADGPKGLRGDAAVVPAGTACRGGRWARAG